MKNVVLVNILLNLGLTVIFVVLNNNILKNGLEETFVSLALIYGIVVVITNAFFVARFGKK
jgi:low temperature requirement protein LtrA